MKQDTTETPGAGENPAGKHHRLLREIAAAGILTALLVALRYVTYPLLGVAPTAAFLIFTTAFLSARVAAYAGACHYVVTGFFLGFGIWVLFQVAAVLLIVAIARVLPKKRWVLCVFAFLAAFLYSFVMLFSALPFVPLPAMPAYILAGLPNDLINAATGAVLVFVLYRKHLIRLLEGYRRDHL